MFFYFVDVYTWTSVLTARQTKCSLILVICIICAHLLVCSHIKLLYIRALISLLVATTYQHLFFVSGMDKCYNAAWVQNLVACKRLVSRLPWKCPATYNDAVSKIKTCKPSSSGIFTKTHVCLLSSTESWFWGLIQKVVN